MNSPQNRSSTTQDLGEGNKPRIQVAVVYQILHHFREPIFTQLVARGDNTPSYRFFASAENDIDSNRTIDPKRADRPHEEGGLPWTFLRNWPLPGPFLWQSGVLRIALDRGIDVVIFLGNMYFLSTWVAALVARLTGKRVLFWGHGYTRREANLKGLIRQIFYRLADATLLYGDRARLLFEDRGFSHDDLYVVYNSLNYARQRDIREATENSKLDALRRRFFREPEFPVIVCIGRLEARKRLDQLIDLIEMLEERGRRINVLIVGDGEVRERLEARVAAKHLTERVHFYGACYEEAEIGPLLMSGSLCVCPGHVGLTAVHAMAYGVPVMTHDDLDDQAPEVEAIVSGETGDLFRRDDLFDIARCVEKWLRSHPDRRSASGACISMIENRYNAERQAHVIDSAVEGVRADARD